MSCSSRIVFIDINNLLSLPPMIPYIEKLAQKFQAALPEFKLVRNEITPLELETLVRDYVNQGYNYIGIPTRDDLIEKFLTGSEIDGRTVESRWPEVKFMVQDYGKPGIYYKNVYFFTDLKSLEDPSLIKFNLINSTKSTGQVYLIYQGKGDPVTEREFKLIQAAFEDLHIYYQSFEVGTIDRTFSQEALQKAVQEISLSLPSLPAKSSVFHIINWFNGENYTQMSKKVGLFSDFNGRLKHYTFLNEYYPIETPLPVDLEIGRIPVLAIPSMEAKEIGLPLDPSEFFSFPYLISYLDSYLWALTCGQTSGINDKQLKFDKDGVRISYYLADFRIPKNTLEIKSGPLYFNPRWFDEKLPVVSAKIIKDLVQSKIRPNVD